MRGDGEPVRPGIGTPRPMSRTNQSAQQNGTRSAESIKASGHNHRINRPDTRLHPTTTSTLRINPCNAGAIHTRHCSRHVRFSVVGVCITPERRRGSGRSRESEDDPTQTFSLDGLPFHPGLFPLYARLVRCGLCGRRARRDLREHRSNKRTFAATMIRLGRLPDSNTARKLSA